MSNPVRPEDMLADGVDSATINGLQVRKGSVAAFVANAKRLDTLKPGDETYDAVLAQMRGLVPTLRAVGVFEVFDLHSSQIAELMEGY